MQIRVYYEDTDCGNVVYYANYLNYMERSRTEYLRERGIDFAVYHENGHLFAVTEAHLRYHAPARYNDLLDAVSTITEITPVTMFFTTEIRRVGEEQLLVRGEVRVACIRTSGRPTRIPEEIRKALTA
jgi:acyl-CoA thioester hydrolase